MKILFNKRGNPRTAKEIKTCVADFGGGYNRIVCKVIESSKDGLNKDVFRQNVAILMPNFLMTRAGPFKGVDFVHGTVEDPKGQIAGCWDTVGNRVVQLRGYLDRQRKGSRVRVLVDMPDPARQETSSELWKIFKRLEPICRGKTTLGLVGASKVLFSVLPEVALPIDNAEWRKVFKTIDFSDIILAMADEISVWEKQTGARLDACDSEGKLTLPAVYNVMAMKARPKAKK